MLKSLQLKDIGPASEMKLEFGSRLNIITGDNGLGKSFLLDIAWWALSRVWVGNEARPLPEQKDPKISFKFDARSKDFDYESIFDREGQYWTNPRNPGRPPNPGMVIYAQVDGGFSVWDPERNYWWEQAGVETPDRVSAYFFQPREVWNGLKDKEKTLSNGLIHDLSRWYLEKGEAFQQFEKVLASLSPSKNETLCLGKPMRVSLDDVREIPTIQTSYGQEVPVTNVSAGIKRILSLAYLLVWTWQEHIQAANLRGRRVTKDIIFLIDEIEAHLHPKWQRVILRALMDVMSAMTNEDVNVQLIVVTHSPLILASIESSFAEEKDKLWTLDLVENEASISEVDWRRHGDANAWLTSEIFDLEEPRSLEAEEALALAKEVLRSNEPLWEDIKKADGMLREVLGELDPFWVRWSSYVERVESRQ